VEAERGEQEGVGRGTHGFGRCRYHTLTDLKGRLSWFLKGFF
jgi:hypothetical protein